MGRKSVGDRVQRPMWRGLEEVGVGGQMMVLQQPAGSSYHCAALKSLAGLKQELRRGKVDRIRLLQDWVNQRFEPDQTRSRGATTREWKKKEQRKRIAGRERCMGKPEEYNHLERKETLLGRSARKLGKQRE